MTLEQARIQELMEHIHKLKDTAQENNSSRVENSNPKVKERVGRTKRVVVNIPSSRLARRTPSSPDSSSSSEEESAHLTHKRKRSSPAKKTSTTSGANYEKLA